MSSADGIVPSFAILTAVGVDGLRLLPTSPSADYNRIDHISPGEVTDSGDAEADAAVEAIQRKWAENHDKIRAAFARNTKALTGVECIGREPEPGNAGAAISRGDALRLSRNILENAERERVECGDAPRTTNQPTAEKLASALSTNDLENWLALVTADRDRLATELLAIKARVDGKVVIDVETAMAADAACDLLGSNVTASILRAAIQRAKEGK